MRRSSDFAYVVRTGSRTRRGHLVVHHAADLRADAPPVVGLVVGRAVGGSVTRHAVSRKLRAQLSARLDALPLGSGTVVRALAGAGDCRSAELGYDLDAALRKLALR